jgi:peroxiredoxin
LKVVAVALGEPKHAERYCGNLAPSVDCYCNQTADVYEVYGLQRAGVTALLNPGMAKAAMRASSKGHTQGKATGDVKMLPGTFIVDTQGVIRYAYYSSHPGDHPDLPELIHRQ